MAVKIYSKVITKVRLNMETDTVPAMLSALK